MQLTNQQIDTFRQHVQQFYGHKARQMPWRSQPTPYFVLVSELMLQQTQVARVVPKFQQFVAAFPTPESLAAAPLAEVLGLWLGLGYNRRAKFLHDSAKVILEQFNGQLPANSRSLQALPGIGPNTAGAIMAYAFNRPAIFVETNIRTVYIHHFFAKASGVDDADIKQLLTSTLDQASPREWYWALMDYGTHLKATVGNNTHRSRHYVRQSKFAGSLRQLRGAVLHTLRTAPATAAHLQTVLSDDRLADVLPALQAEGLIEQRGNIFCLTGNSKLP